MLTELIGQALTNYIKTNQNRKQRTEHWQSLVQEALKIQEGLRTNEFNFKALIDLSNKPGAASDSDECLKDLIAKLMVYYNYKKVDIIKDAESDDKRNELKKLSSATVVGALKTNELEELPNLAIAVNNARLQNLSALKSSKDIAFAGLLENKITALEDANHVYHGSQQYNDFLAAVVRLRNYVNTHGCDANWKKYRDNALKAGQLYLNYKADDDRTINNNGRTRIKLVNKIINEISFYAAETALTEKQIKKTKAEEKNKRTGKDNIIEGNNNKINPQKEDQKYKKAEHIVNNELQLQQVSYVQFSASKKEQAVIQTSKNMIAHFVILKMIDAEKQAKDPESPITNCVNNEKLEKLLKGLTTSENFNNKFGNMKFDDCTHIIQDMKNANSKVSQDCIEIGQQFLQGYRQSISKNNDNIIVNPKKQEPLDIVEAKIQAYCKEFNSSRGNESDKIGKKIIASTIVLTLIDQEADTNETTLSDMVNDGKFDNIVNRLMETNYFKDAFKNSFNEYKNLKQLFQDMADKGSAINNKCENTLEQFKKDYKANPKMLQNKTNVINMH